MNTFMTKGMLIAFANEMDLYAFNIKKGIPFSIRTDLIKTALYEAVECIQHLEATVKAAQDDMEAIAHKLDDGFVCFYCGANTLEDCGKCEDGYQGFKWRGFQEED